MSDCRQDTVLENIFKAPVMTFLIFTSTIIVGALWADAALNFYRKNTWENPTPSQSALGALIVTIISTFLLWLYTVFKRDSGKCEIAK